MSDPILNLTDPTRFFPRLRKVIAAIVRPALRQYQKAGQQRAGYKNQGAIMAWCADNFSDLKAAYHYLRIERHLGRASMMLRGKFELTEIHTPESHSPGYYLWRGFKRKRR